MTGLLLCLLPGLFRYDVGIYQRRIDRDRSACFLSTLTCHFFELLFLSFDVFALAVGVIEPCCTVRLVFAVGFAALGQTGTKVAVFAAVALAAIARAADIKYDAAFRTSTHSLAYLNDWQDSRAFPKAGLDNGRQSWQAMSD
jgi:hypothetical protein